MQVPYQFPEIFLLEQRTSGMAVLDLLGQIVGVIALLFVVYLIYKKIFFYLANPSDTI